MVAERLAHQFVGPRFAQLRLQRPEERDQDLGVYLYLLDQRYVHRSPPWLLAGPLDQMSIRRAARLKGPTLASARAAPPAPMRWRCSSIHERPIDGAVVSHARHASVVRHALGARHWVKGE